MKKIENYFVLSGFVGKDASIHQFSTASVARFSQTISRTEKNREETNRTSAFMNVEAFLCFWALFFLTEPYKFALYPTFSLPLCIYFKNIV